MKYHIWTAGCQMNVADSQRVASSLERLGYEIADDKDNADVIVMNTCVVRQSAEDKAHGFLTSLNKQKRNNPNLIINLMGCMVGVKGTEHLQKRYPHVDVFSPPSDPGPLIAHITQDESRELAQSETQVRNALMDGDLILPAHENNNLVSAHVPVVLGCSHACTFCIIPYRRGIERSRPVGAIVKEVRNLVSQGVKEITLLGQIVDRYGKDVPDGPNLSQLLRIVAEVEGLERIRFLTSHPNWMTNELLQTVADIPKVMPHIEVPVQAGNNLVLENMKREYTRESYIDLITRIREIIPNVSIATDIIVGFPHESEEQFMGTFSLLEELRLDVAHLARYSTREGTVATRRLGDDVTDEEKRRRFRLLEDQQARIVGEINAKLLGETVDVLFEEKVKGRWKGRTPNMKLVFVESDDNLKGKILPAQITWTGPYSMQGRLLNVQTGEISRMESLPIIG
ncbi:MAG: tRNA (N6-isopentenyl adenosine(37)-C2)-methylthiotransferase MiaB [Chloroflexi bacterium]|jgi:tRNA-2-methylthio-N6-dimethylallyladenosine synthase|nr:tRNA (N6-isopentenyl adenosine(37)-C2)-methylthiotransferase MiaB [Chloroflexota bacterium]MBT3668637.1 tRNA (N6-isopentenyl adenosine(37)-C2)-methylthiotransferase MiaB [Chloroflexota bacterium]MBT4002008.1 tRNA (N6-isopentenyl adenosine(37)-C2)-methylthiotransferase MiaB [Chloroflexota bacterium]MBT4304140.1 tRNA (N6-isopentenyl adenosine(37)-C2)-methylthiotransferase MiaB [Chloroflexota bacterium]MBT4533226.1 tRNA (N6-isopentenyl adenosine(37)-C2)-methylthiotransferase MiaB [Chloroflexota